MKLQESAEMYLETIVVLGKELEKVRSVDIARSMGFSKPSVSVAIHSLADSGYININSDSSITLTEAGLEIASRIYERHQVISDFLKKIGVDEKIAESDACKIEHDISDESFFCLKNYLKGLKYR